jgi:tripartite-type tricarboxylate transporter receptor subunit TctC
MPTSRRTFLIGTGAVAASGLLPRHASAQAFSKPLQIIVGQPPGGGTDTYGRALAAALPPFANNQAAVVVNKSGGNGVLAQEYVMGSNPDGYTLSLTSAGSAVIKRVWDGNGPDLVTDMKPVGTIGMYSSCIVVRKDSPYKGIKDFIEGAKASSKPVLWAHTGRGSIHHIAAQALIAKYGLPAKDVPYQGAPEARNALANGEVAFAAFGTQNLTGFEEQVRTVGILSDQRDPFVVGAQTIVEQGVDAPLFFTPIMVHAPKNTPADVMKALEEAVKKATASDVYKQATRTASLVVYYRSAADTQKWTEQAAKQWAPIILQVRDAGKG